MPTRPRTAWLYYLAAGAMLISLVLAYPTAHWSRLVSLSTLLGAFLLLAMFPQKPRPAWVSGLFLVLALVAMALLLARISGLIG